MTKSLKTKILVPCIGVVSITLISIIVYMSISVAHLTENLAADRAVAVSQAVRLRLDERKEYSTLTAASMAQNEYLIRHIQNGDMEGLLSLLESKKDEIGVFNLVVTDSQGRVLMRTNAPGIHGDSLAALSNVASALRGRPASTFSPGALIPMAISSSAPIYSDGQLIGALIANFNMASDDFVDEFSEVFLAEVSVYKGNTIVASTLLNEQGTRTIGSESAGEISDSVIGKSEVFTAQMTLRGEQHNVFYFPLIDMDNNAVGMFFLGFSTEHERITLQVLQRTLIIISAASIALAVAIILFSVMQVLKPITLLRSTINDMANGDLTQRLPSKGNDEIAETSRSFNQAVEKMGMMIVAIKEQAATLSGIGNNLASDMNQTAAATNEITANIQSIKNRVVSQSASVTETHAAMEQVVGNINKINGYIENQNDHISQASTSVEKMVASARSVNDTLHKNANNVKMLMEASEIGRTGLQTVAADIQGIASESEALMQINSVIKNIASQTNLLSMNAAIEAAHAGEAGKGFAVVADEIRKLAEGSAEQSKTINAVLKKVKASIDKITNSTESVLNKFASIDASIRTVADQELQIRSAMAEQSADSTQTNSDITHVIDITSQVKTGSHEMSAGAKEVIQESANLERVTQEIAAGMNEMILGVEQINKAVNNINAIGGQNREGINVLIEEVSRFKVA